MTNQPNVGAVPARPTNPWAVAAFVLSLFGWIGLPVPIISGILAFVALREIEQHREGGRALAQFARAFAVLLTLVILLHGRHAGWMANANW